MDMSSGMVFQRLMPEGMYTFVVAGVDDDRVHGLLVLVWGTERIYRELAVYIPYFIEHDWTLLKGTPTEVGL